MRRLILTMMLATAAASAGYATAAKPGMKRVCTSVIITGSLSPKQMRCWFVPDGTAAATAPAPAAAPAPPAGTASNP